MHEGPTEKSLWVGVRGLVRLFLGRATQRTRGVLASDGQRNDEAWAAF